MIRTDRCNFCVGVDLDSDEDDNEVIDNRNNKSPAKFHLSESEVSMGPRSLSLESIKEAGFFKKAIFWICGIEHALNTGFKESEIKHQVDTSIEQNEKWAMICNACAVFAFALTVSSFGFFNKFN